MALFFVTGFPGSGKTSVSTELRKRGYTSYDTDNIPGWARLIDRHTHKPVKKKPRILPPHYYDTEAEWDWDKDKIEKLISNTTGNAFICAVMSNQQEFYRYFDKIFVLILDSKTMEERLITRAKRNFSQQPNELQDVLAKHKKFEHELKQYGAIAIDATKPLVSVVDEIIAKSGKDQTL